MAQIHQTTMTPSKLDLLASWLPRQPWYRGSGAGTELSRAGGFRLDDPAGEVGIEFYFASDGTNVYQVPMTYRGAPLPDADPAALIGTSEHGVLGTRWIYDGAHDPVLLAQLLAFLAGDVPAQHQSRSDTLDPSVTRALTLPGRSALDPSGPAHGRKPADDAGTGCTAIRLDGRLSLHVVRRLSGPAASPRSSATAGATGPLDEQVVGQVEVELHEPDGTPARRRVALLTVTAG